MSAFWLPVIVGGVVGFLLKLTGYSLPESVIGRPVVRRIASLLPIAMLSALMLVQTFGKGQALVLDARIGGLIAAIVALRFKAPFIVVVIIGAATAAILRAAGWAV